jgi:hypothetical protein
MSIANILNPTSILQQPKSSITTNPFIPNEQKEFEVENLDTQTSDEYPRSDINKQTIKQINQNISSSFIGLIDDLFSKPTDVPWKHYILIVIQKDQRYTYLGILILLIATYLLLVRN